VYDSIAYQAQLAKRPPRLMSPLAVAGVVPQHRGNMLRAQAQIVKMTDAASSTRRDHARELAIIATSGAAAFAWRASSNALARTKTAKPASDLG
jgi:hypothetical protein